MICGVCAIGLHYLILKFLSVNLFLWGHELANSFLLFSVHKSFLQIIKNFSLRHRLHFLLTLSYGLQVASTSIAHEMVFSHLSGSICTLTVQSRFFCLRVEMRSCDFCICL